MTIDEIKQEIGDTIMNDNLSVPQTKRLVLAQLETLESAIRLEEAKNYNAKLDQYFKKSEALDEVKTNS